MVFSGHVFSSEVIPRKDALDFNLCTRQHQSPSPKMAQGTDILQWTPPYASFIKINVDAAFVPNKGATGAIAQDHDGQFLGCETSTFDATSSLMAESFACKLGISLAKSLSLQHVIIEGDAKNVTSTILGDSRDIPWSIRSVILDIRNEANSLDNIRFIDVPKHVNQLAHNLCQYAMDENVTFRWNASYPPDCISSNLSFNLFFY
ncbi:uncharacterized protein LOC113290752 [Papaver somniferum]|uniref:uncharacterized protein LOC113290752 n=1 Tax=Papaver somniferum TaxID=3469 RepID=UPI000E702875|nr:uncharacterized protein LOC113290752 [Papaver somniferum]